MERGYTMNELQLTGNSSITAAQAITDELYSRYISYVDAKPKTIETYTRALKQFFSYMKLNGIAQPVREDIIAFREELKPDHKPTTVQNYITTVRQFFKWTEQERIYPNVADHIKGAKLDAAHKKDYLTSKQVKTVLSGMGRDSVQGLRDYAIMVLMITAGLRTIEIIRADTGDLRTAGDSTVLFIQGKGRDEKTDYVKVAEPAEDAIRAYLKARGEADPKQPLFASEANRNSGERLTTRSVSRIVKETLINAGFDSDRLTAHSLRHTAATLNLLNGGSLAETQQLLRHTSINTTMIYNHQLERANNNSEARVAKAIFG
jgi:integrase/recombinase XerD